MYYTYPFNLTGQPAASINIGFDKENLPIGMQIISKINQETTIFGLANELEKTISLKQYKPNI